MQDRVGSQNACYRMRLAYQEKRNPAAGGFHITSKREVALCSHREIVRAKATQCCTMENPIMILTPSRGRHHVTWSALLQTLPLSNILKEPHERHSAWGAGGKWLRWSRSGSMAEEKHLTETSDVLRHFCDKENHIYRVCCKLLMK